MDAEAKELTRERPHSIAKSLRVLRFDQPAVVSGHRRMLERLRHVADELSLDLAELVTQLTRIASLHSCDACGHDWE